MTLNTDGPYALKPEEGEALWFVDTLMTVKAGGEQTRGAFTLIEYTCAPGFAPPPHIHHAEDEAFYILEGEKTVTCGDRTWTAGPGAFVFLPRGIPHTYEVRGPTPLRGLQITTPAQFERFAAEVGEPARSLTLPPPGLLDVEKLLSVSTRYQIEMVGPPPGASKV